MTRLLAALLLTLAPWPARAGEEATTSPASQPVYRSVVTTRRPLARDRTGSASLVDGERLRQSPRFSTLEALSAEAADLFVTARGAGIHGVASGASGAIHVRGLGGSPNTQVLVVEDGVPDVQGIFGHPIPDAYVPALVDEVLLVKGGDSVLYGSNAMGGVIVLRSRWRGAEGLTVESDTGYGSYSTARESAVLLGRRGGWDIAGAVSALKTDGHRAGAGGSSLVGQLAVRRRVTGALSLTLRNRLARLDGADPGPVSHPAPDHWYRVWRESLSLGLALHGARLRLDATPYLNVGLHRLHDGFYSRDYTGGLRLESSARPLRPLRLLLGFAADISDGLVENHLSGEASPVEPLTSYSLYGQLAARLLGSPPLTLIVGGRALQSSLADLVLLYKAGLRWDLPRGLRLHGRVSRNVRLPTLRELYLPFPTANPDLEPELALCWDVGASFVSEHLELSLTGFRTEAKNLIKYFGAWPGAEVVNIDSYLAWGFEGKVRLTRLGPASFTVAAGWQDVGRYSRQNPEARLSWSLAVGRRRGAHFFGGMLGGEWVGGLYMANYRRDPLDDVFFMDMSLRYRYRSPVRALSIEPYLLLRNILDRPYAYIAGYTMPGFNALLGLKVGI